MVNFSYDIFYKELELLLPASSAAQRRIWATTILENNIDIKDLSSLLTSEPKIATRFLWLLSEIGTFDPNTLLNVLPFLLELSDSLNPVYKQSFASFWFIVGVPLENEGRAIDLLFKLLWAADTNTSIKSRALFVLFKLTQKYPELKNEFKLCLNDQLGKYSVDFDKKVTKLITALEQ